MKHWTSPYSSPHRRWDLTVQRPPDLFKLDLPIPDTVKLVHYESHVAEKGTVRVLLGCFLVFFGVVTHICERNCCLLLKHAPISPSVLSSIVKNYQHHLLTFPTDVVEKEVDTSWTRFILTRLIRQHG